MNNLGINAPMGETVRKVGPISFVRTQGPNTSPTYDIVHDSGEGKAFGQVFRGSIGIEFYADLPDGDVWDGPDLVAIGQFVSDLNDHYKKGPTNANT